MERDERRWDEESSKRIISAESIERKISANKEKESDSERDRDLDVVGSSLTDNRDIQNEDTDNMK